MRGFEPPAFTQAQAVGAGLLGFFLLTWFVIRWLSA